MSKITIEPGTIAWTKLPLWKSIKIWFKEGTWTRHLLDIWYEKDEVTAKDFDSKKVDLFEPVKPYSKVESKKLCVIVEHETDDNKNEIFIDDMLTAINLVRPNTVDTDGDMDQFYNHKYYKCKKVRF